MNREEATQAIRKLFRSDYNSHGEQFVEILYNKGFEICRLVDVRLEDEKKSHPEQSGFMKEWEDYDDGGMFAINLDEAGRKQFHEIAEKMTQLEILRKIDLLVILIDKHKADKPTCDKPMTEAEEIEETLKRR